MRFKFHARHTSAHSPVTFFKPRGENWRKAHHRFDDAEDGFDRLLA
jgi:hypothetical protein